MRPVPFFSELRVAQALLGQKEFLQRAYRSPEGSRKLREPYKRASKDAKNEEKRDPHRDTQDECEDERSHSRTPVDWFFNLTLGWFGNRPQGRLYA